MDPFRYRKAYEAMLHTTQLIEDRLRQEFDPEEEATAQNDVPKAAFLGPDPDSMDWTPTESVTPPPECGPPPALSKKLRHLLPGGGDGDLQAEDTGENAVLLHKMKEGKVMDECIDKLVNDLPDVLSYQKSVSFTP